MLKGYIAEMGLDHIVKNVILSERDKKILQERMEDFLERQGTINEFSLRDEEIDFGALAEYLRVDLFDDIHAYFEANWRNRGTVKAGIISKAISYAQANTNVSRKRAVEFTEKAIELIRYYKKTKLGDDLKLIVSELQECVVDTVEHSTESQTKELKRIGAEAKEELLSAVKYNNLMSLDRNVELLQVGKIEQVEMNIKNVLKAMNSAHSLFPNYGYDYNGRFYSKPLTQEALEIYPPKISCTGTAQIDGKYINKLDRDTIEYANRHQLPIVLNIITAKKFLGDIEDPVQYEATDLVGEKITRV